MDCNHIKLLLDKFWACETTLEEEKELRYFFNHHLQIPEEWKEYQTLFVYQEQEQKIRLDDRFDEKIRLAIQQDCLLHWKKWKIWIQVAAMLLLCIGGYRLFHENRKVVPETCLTPEDALVEVKQALNFVSLKLNRSQQLVERNRDEIELINQYLKQ